MNGEESFSPEIGMGQDTLSAPEKDEAAESRELAEKYLAQVPIEIFDVKMRQRRDDFRSAVEAFSQKPKTDEVDTNSLMAFREAILGLEQVEKLAAEINNIFAKYEFKPENIVMQPEIDRQKSQAAEVLNRIYAVNKAAKLEGADRECLSNYLGTLQDAADQTLEPVQNSIARIEAEITYAKLYYEAGNKMSAARYLFGDDGCTLDALYADKNRYNDNEKLQQMYSDLCKLEAYIFAYDED